MEIGNEQSAEVVYYLATHPEEFRRISELTMTPEKPTPEQVGRAVRIAAREFARIEHLIETDAASAPPKQHPETKKSTRPAEAPPPPVETVGTRSAGRSTDEYRDDMSQAEYREWRARHPRG
jgi:hypothetical protein